MRRWTSRNWFDGDTYPRAPAGLVADSVTGPAGRPVASFGRGAPCRGARRETGRVRGDPARPGTVPTGRLQCPGQDPPPATGRRSTSSQCTGAREGPGRAEAGHASTINRLQRNGRRRIVTSLKEHIIRQSRARRPSRTAMARRPVREDAGDVRVMSTLDIEAGRVPYGNMEGLGSSRATPAVACLCNAENCWNTDNG